MKRTIKISATDGASTVDIVVNLRGGKGLMRREVNYMIDGLASDIMKTVPNMSHSNIPLSRVKVK